MSYHYLDGKELHALVRKRLRFSTLQGEVSTNPSHRLAYQVSATRYFQVSMKLLTDI